MAKYLDPKADLTFKKIIGEHPKLVISLLNALLPFSEEQKITEIEYLPAELTPDNPMRKNSIVDVRCKATDGLQFIVEMQMEWTTAFKQRVLFNATKAYIRQLKKSKKYHLLQPVYSLSLVNDVLRTTLRTSTTTIVLFTRSTRRKSSTGCTSFSWSCRSLSPILLAKRRCRCFGSVS